ncbi:hypothetical protein [Paractinoplanes durhamensis]|uniref:hypothetical protein n=1 Tax=Paractinoplanes durhamensis TaxID=113563 RepID=UPI0036445B7A
MRFEAVMARASRGLCLAKLGAFGEAGDDFELARKGLRGLSGEQHDEAASLLGLNEGWMLGQLGEPRAQEVLTEGLAIARKSADALLIAKLLDGLAVVHCDNRQIDDAVRLALEAARIAMRTGNPSLTRLTNVTLALAYLFHDDRTDNAATAVHTACQQPPGHQALAARAVEGVVEFRETSPPRGPRSTPPAPKPGCGSIAHPGSSRSSTASVSLSPDCSCPTSRTACREPWTCTRRLAGSLRCRVPAAGPRRSSPC